MMRQRQQFKIEPANQYLADAVDDHLAGQQAATRLVAEIRANVGSGEELGDAIGALAACSAAYTKGFGKTLQKLIAAGGQA